MEHQTAIAYGNNYKTGYNGYDFSRIGLDFDYIIIHESGHEYWGNLISAADIADLWIHEGFCTYSEALYVECMYDYQKALDYVNAKKPTIGNQMPMLGIKSVNHEGDGDMYNKGMLFLNTMRHIINNDELWFGMLKEMTSKEFAYKTTDTESIIAYFNKKAAMDLTPVFNQYLAYPDIPKLYYSIEMIDKKNYKLKYKWLTDVQDFFMPIVLKVGKQEYRLFGNTELQSFKFTRKKKDQISFDEERFYFNKKESNF
ncbi:MAG: M1 family aminopeptidase, partial [Chitinophagales bacterium]